VCKITYRTPGTSNFDVIGKIKCLQYLSELQGFLTL